MNITPCNAYDIYNCSGNCYICNISATEIEHNYNIFPYCTETKYCISNLTQCENSVYLDHCILSNTFIKIMIGILIICLYIGAYHRILTAYRTYGYSINKQTTIVSIYSIINLIIPIILLFLTNILYLEYFIICVVSYV